MNHFQRKAAGMAYWRSEFALGRSLLEQQQSPQGLCAVQLEGHLEGEQSCLCKCKGECLSLQRGPEIHSVTKNCNSKSMTPSKSSQTMPKIIEKEWRVSSVQPELDSCVLCSNAWDLMEMGQQPGDTASQYRTRRTLMLEQIMRKGQGLKA